MATISDWLLHPCICYKRNYSRLRLIEPPWDRPYLVLISGVSYYPAGLFSKNSEFITKGGSNKRRELLTGELTEVYCINRRAINRSLLYLQTYMCFVVMFTWEKAKKWVCWDRREKVWWRAYTCFSEWPRRNRRNCPYFNSAPDYFQLCYKGQFVQISSVVLQWIQKTVDNRTNWLRKTTILGAKTEFCIELFRI